MITFFVAGVPVPKGSAKAFVIKGKGGGKPRAIVTQDNLEKQKPWASSISYVAQKQGCWRMIGPVDLTLEFTMPRIKGHFGSGKKAEQLKPNAPIHHTVKPDLDKLIRCVKDALTGVIWNDDSQVCAVTALKFYGPSPGVKITIKELQ